MQRCHRTGAMDISHKQDGCHTDRVSRTGTLLHLFLGLNRNIGLWIFSNGFGSACSVIQINVSLGMFFKLPSPKLFSDMIFKQAKAV